jgi:hypothetical protein
VAEEIDDRVKARIWRGPTVIALMEVDLHLDLGIDVRAVDPVGSSSTARDGKTGRRSLNSTPDSKPIPTGRSTTSQPATTQCMRRKVPTGPAYSTDVDYWPCSPGGPRLIVWHWSRAG